MRAATFAAGILAMLAGPAQAQFVPLPYLSGETRGRVVDAESGRPVEGAIVVARWDWLTYSPGNLHSPPSYDKVGEAVHVSEAVTDGNGAFTIAAWGPATKVGGRIAEGVPRLLVFKAGYEPLNQDAGKQSPVALRIRKSSGDPREYASSIAAFQGGARSDGGLFWRSTPDGAAIPRMVLAIHREKARLGEDGAPILGANLMRGRSGKGEVVEARSRQPVTTGGVVWIAWTMRRLDGAPGTKRLVQAKPLGIEGSSSQFYVSPWRFPAPDMPGWERATDVPPQVRIYAAGYARSADLAWEESGSVVAIGKLPETREGRLEELQTMRRDMDAELGASGDRTRALAALGPMLWRFMERCRAITPDLRVGLCYDDASDAAKQAEATRRIPSFEREDAEGVRTIRIVATAAPAPQAAAMRAGPDGSPPRGRIGGFSIEPTR